MDEQVLDGNVSTQPTKKVSILIVTEQHLAQLNDLFERFVPPAYSRPIVAILNTCPKQDVDVPVQA